MSEYKCHKCENHHTTENMVSYCAVCYDAYRLSSPSAEIVRAEIEAVADECHKQWAGWTEHLLSKHGVLPSGNMILGAEWKHRWMKQVNTPYSELSDPEKESDRCEARKILSRLAALRKENTNG